MIIPQPEDIDYADRYTRDFKGRTSLLLERPSPILPLHYDKKYLPSKCRLNQKIYAKKSI